MKAFRLVAICSLMLAMIISLTGCMIIPVHKYYDDIDREQVSSVDFYDLRNSETTRQSDFLKTETAVYTLPQDQLDGFFDDLANIRFTDRIIIVLAAIDSFGGYYDWVARINYTDGSYSLISCDEYGALYDATGQEISFNRFGCDDYEWEQFIGKYVPKDIFENPKPKQ